MSYSRKGSTVSVILLTGAAVTYWEYAQYFLIALVAYLVLKTVYRVYRFCRSLVQYFGLKDIDSMDGIAFEHFIAGVLKNQGYSNVSLTEQYDYGVDIVAEKDGVRWGIQVKRYSGLVKAEAVRQVVTGLRLYGCERAMVITNSTFSNVARTLAAGNDCVLIDRSELHQLTR